MKITGTYRIAAPPAAVWRKLMDPAVLERVMPGCEKLEPNGDNSYRAVMKAGVGPIRGTFNSEITLSDIVPERNYKLSTHAKSALGFVDGRGEVELQAQGAETVINFSGEVKVGGALASIAGRLIDAAARKNIQDAFANLAREVQTA